MSATTERFIRLYEALVAEVNRRAGDPSSHSFQIERAAIRDGAVKRQETLLKYIRDVRHAIQHPKHQSPGHAVTISEAFLEEIDSLLTHLRNPPTASSTGVPRKEIRTADLTDRLGDLAEKMKRNRFSHLPILNERDIVIGVFNEAAVFDYLWSETVTIVGRDMLIRDIFDHCRLHADRSETFKFVKPSTPLDSLVDMFAGVESRSTRIGAVFVTPSGKATDPIHRLITPWDVLVGSASG